MIMLNFDLYVCVCYRALLVLRQWVPVRREVEMPVLGLVMLEAVITREHMMLIPCTAVMHRCMNSTT